MTTATSERALAVTEHERGSRFVDVGPDSDLFKSKSLNDLKPYYNGVTLTDRMAEIRKSIYHIRTNWHDFEQFLAASKSLVFENGENVFKDEKTREQADRLFTMTRNWIDESGQDREAITYEALKLYTSKEGYKQIYGLANRIFRQEDSIDITELVRSVVFLVELINIDLFNYCTVTPARCNFEGVVYRGLCLETEDIELYRKLRQEPFSKRNIAVPLGLVSSSLDIHVAKRFISEQLQKPSKTTDLHPLLVKIHVIGLKPEYMDLYRSTFPTSVISTICAVDIHDLSVFPEESEVLLRGPFFVVLDMYQDNSGGEDVYAIDGKPVDVLDVVMLNTNRDHISTARLGDQDAKARDMFGAMVTITRAEFAIKYCRDKGLDDDAQEYTQLLASSLAKLDAVVKN